MPAGGIVAVVIRHVIPIIEITGCDTIFIFVDSNDWVGDIAEASIESIGSTVPVVKLDRGTLLVYINQVAEQIRVTRIDHAGDCLRLQATSGAITSRSQNKWLSGRRRSPRGGRKGVGVDRWLYHAIAEEQRDRRTLRGEGILHQDLDRQRLAAIHPVSRRQGK